MSLACRPPWLITYIYSISCSLKTEVFVDFTLKISQSVFELRAPQLIATSPGVHFQNIFIVLYYRCVIYLMICKLFIHIKRISKYQGEITIYLKIFQLSCGKESGLASQYAKCKWLSDVRWGLLTDHSYKS